MDHGSPHLPGSALPPLSTLLSPFVFRIHSRSARLGKPRTPCDPAWSRNFEIQQLHFPRADSVPRRPAVPARPAASFAGSDSAAPKSSLPSAPKSPCLPTKIVRAHLCETPPPAQKLLFRPLN